ncbi:MAG: hypothetical protein Q8O67_08970 [Deltaproteobacteria bacterium]|nr:hypothetical protein [Deltaproteobacteria bacterium]
MHHELERAQGQRRGDPAPLPRAWHHGDAHLLAGQPAQRGGIGDGDSEAAGGVDVVVGGSQGLPCTEKSVTAMRKPRRATTGAGASATTGGGVSGPSAVNMASTSKADCSMGGLQVCGEECSLGQHAPIPCNNRSVSLEIVFDDPLNYFALLDRRVLVQVRQGALTHAALDAAAASILPILRAQTLPIGVLAIINGDAGVMPPDIRARQTDLIGGLLKLPGSWMATVMGGSTVHATAMRAVGRVLLIGNRNLTHAKDVNEATTWLAARLGDITAGALRDVVATLQQRGKTR